MKKPVFVRSLIVIVVATGIMIAGIFLITRKNNVPSPVTQSQIETVEEKVPSQTTKTYTDEAGFSFVYPDDLTVVKKESTDAAVYSEITVNSQKVDGSLSFVVEDTKVKTLDEWITKNLSASMSATKDVKLGELLAKEVTVNGKIVTVAIDQGVLFRFDVIPEKDSSYWMSAYNTILSQFSFVAPQAVSDSSSSSGGEDIILEEEVIE